MRKNLALSLICLFALTACKDKTPEQEMAEQEEAIRALNTAVQETQTMAARIAGQKQSAPMAQPSNPSGTAPAP